MKLNSNCKNFTKFILLSLFIFFQEQSFCQVANNNNIIGEDLPPIIENEFNVKYSGAQNVSWKVSHVTYWFNDNVDDWYDDWYSNRVAVDYKFDRANFYQVTFLNSDGELSKALYTKFGYWYETRTKINKLPSSVKKGISNSNYKNWTQSVHMEKIESVAWPITVYRIEVKFEKRKHIIRLDEKGNILQIKKLNDA